MSNDVIVGPVCHIPPTTTTANPQVKSIPGVLPAPTNLPSALNAIRNLQEIVRYLTNQVVNNNTGGGTISTKAQPGDFTQTDIQTEKVKIYQNNDKTSDNWVEVEQVNGLTFKDKLGNKWQYTRQG